ncbi:hypothetical protein MM326_13555 [Alkalihalobacillus sp. LMS6]|nr:hypothetical protein [Alkalihalobacillus sp. LMS6]UTR05134.1 hypothetical protein MM326_13555 [Alkalihalobacillus sp. LMS6]
MKKVISILEWKERKRKLINEEKSSSIETAYTFLKWQAGKEATNAH